MNEIEKYFGKSMALVLTISIITPTIFFVNNCRSFARKNALDTINDPNKLTEIQNICDPDNSQLINGVRYIAEFYGSHPYVLLLIVAIVGIILWWIDSNK